MLIPEIILFNTITAFQTLLAQDYNAATDKTQTALHDMFGQDDNLNNLQLEKFNYLTQAVALFTRTQESPRQFTVNVGYNLNRAMLPTVHILLPQETPGRYNAIGLNEGEIPTEYHPEATPQYETITRARSYRASFDLMVTSDNSSEVLLIYYMIKNMLVYTGDTFELLGLHNYELTGQDVQLDAAYAPPNVFHRSIRLTFDYIDQTKLRNYRDMASRLNFMICSNFAVDNTPKPSGPQQYVSNNYIITINNHIDTGAKGYINLINKLTNVIEVTKQITLTGNDTNLQYTGSLSPANYKVEINLNNFVSDLVVLVNDGVNEQYDSSGTPIEQTYYKMVDLAFVQSNGIYINLYFT